MKRNKERKSSEVMSKVGEISRLGMGPREEHT